MNLAVVTVVAGRADHLRAQLAGLARSTLSPVRHSIVAMGDPAVHEVVAAVGSGTRPRVDVVTDIAVPDGRLPLAAARNLGAQIACAAGDVDLLVFLDVDCIPGDRLLSRYAGATAEHPDALLCGPVTYLSEQAKAYDLDTLAAQTAPHPARPDPPDGVTVLNDDHDLFWSLSFAVSTPTWQRLGGFCEQYVGYGAEDTDLGATACRLGLPMGWVGGAHAYHQHHPVSRPPVEHLHDIVANAAVFHRRWDRWPMPGWLDAFERQGLLRRVGKQIRVTTNGATPLHDGRPQT